MGILGRLRAALRGDTLADFPAIETARLRIAPLRPVDARALQLLTDDPAITGAVDFLPHRFGLDDAERLIRRAGDGRDLFLGMHVSGMHVSGMDVLGMDGQGGLVGVVGAHLRAGRAVEIGYWVGGAARGQGYAAEAVGAVVAGLSRRFPRRLVVAECHPENRASMGLLRRLGFRETGDEGHRPGRRLLVWEPP